MRVVLTAWGSRGDVEPLVGLAVAVREAGAEALVCVPPSEEFAALLERAGVPWVPLGPSVRSVVTSERPDPFRLAAELVAARFETLTAAAEGSDAIVATGLMPAGARDVAEKLGLRYVLACYHLLGIPSAHNPPGRRPGTQSPEGETDNRVLWQQDAQRVDKLYGEALNTHRAALGLPPVAGVRDHVLTEHPWLAADPTLCPSDGKTDLELVQTGAWSLPDDRPLPSDVDRFLDAGEPPVYVGFGSMAAPAAKEGALAAVAAARAVGRRVILASGWADVTSDCLVVGDINHQALFPRVAAVIHHGGAGTTTTAARAGAPQVLVPQIADQPFWAGRVTALGIGATPEAPTVDSLSAALSTALSPSTRTQAAALAPKIKPDGAAVAAELLLN